MKDFTEFCDYLSQRIGDDPAPVPDIAHIYTMDKLTLENLNAVLQSNTEDIVMLANRISMYYLRIYHEWLQEQLA